MVSRFRVGGSFVRVVVCLCRTCPEYCCLVCGFVRSRWGVFLSVVAMSCLLGRVSRELPRDGGVDGRWVSCPRCLPWFWCQSNAARSCRGLVLVPSRCWGLLVFHPVYLVFLIFLMFFGRLSFRKYRCASGWNIFGIGKILKYFPKYFNIFAR